MLEPANNKTSGDSDRVVFGDIPETPSFWRMESSHDHHWILFSFFLCLFAVAVAVAVAHVVVVFVVVVFWGGGGGGYLYAGKFVMKQDICIFRTNM